VKRWQADARRSEEGAPLKGEGGVGRGAAFGREARAKGGRGSLAR
jgi:hypothetical protein